MVPFLAVSETLFPFCIISPWFQHGNILEYIQKAECVNRLELVSDPRQSLQLNRLTLVRQLAQAACGLEYLHSLNIVHGSVKPVSDKAILSLMAGSDGRSIQQNILIGEDDTACLADFGIIGVMMDPTDQVVTLKLHNFNGVRYMAPELLNPSGFSLPTNESDVYSLAVTAYEARSFRTARDYRSSPTLIFH